MSVEIEKYLALQEQHVLLLQALAQQLVGCRKGVVAMELDGMHGRIAEQESLCRQIQSLHPAIDSLQQTCAKELDPGRLDAVRRPEDLAWAERLRCVMSELGQTQAEVSRLNQIQAAYLRRSRRTVDMLMNFMGNYALTYAPPAGPTLPAARMAKRS